MWKDFFYYTRAEQRGIAVLLILILLVLVARFSLPYWAWYFTSHEEDEEFVKSVQALNEQLIAKENGGKTDSVFYFNPNRVTKEELIMLGFSNYQRKTFLAYRNKIERFKTKSDLLKVYGMDTILYSKLEDYIVLDNIKNKIKLEQITKASVPLSLVWINFNKQTAQFWEQHINSDSKRAEVILFLKSKKKKKSLPLYKIKEYSDIQLIEWLQKRSKPKFGKKYIQKPVVMVELNAADTSELSSLRGIGDKLSVRIINFRDALGGFYNKAQLKDVYGISDELYDNIKEQISVDTTYINKLDPRTYNVKEISRHFYFKFEQAKELKNLYRKNQSPKAEDILKLRSIDKKDWDKIKHYLEYDE